MNDDDTRTPTPEGLECYAEASESRAARRAARDVSRGPIRTAEDALGQR